MQRFSRADGIENLDAKAVLEPLKDCSWQRLASGNRPAHAAQIKFAVGALGVDQHCGEVAGNRKEQRRSMLFNHAEDVRRIC